MKNLVLASSSPYRRELLQRLRIPFEIISPDIDESPQPEESPEALVKRLSLEKAHDDDTEEDFAQDQLEVKNRIETLTQKDLEQTIREYPEKKAVVDGERQVVIELIDMVEDIDTDNLRDAHRREQLSTALGRSSSMLAQVTRREERALPQRERPQVSSCCFLSCVLS